MGYTTKYEYDKFNRVIRTVYPSGYTIKNVFNDKGYLTEILDETRNKTLWKIKDIYPDGKIKTVEKGGGIYATHKFDVHGFNEGYAVKKGENLIADWGYEWDKPKGQLFKRVNNKRPTLFETFSYDQDRLSKVIRPDGSYSCDIEYSDNKQSQIKEKSDFGKYTYDPQNTPNAVREVELVDGVTGQAPQNIEYNAFNSAYDIKHQDTGDHLQITYGNDEQRVSSLLTTTSGEVSKTFLGGYEIISTNGETKQIHYLQAPDGLLGLYVTSSNGGSTFYYAFTDYQGTIQELTDENGVVKFEQSFDAWGNSRNTENWQLKTGENSFSSFNWVRGYTMHESLPEFGLINMNGRMYDPKTGLMLSPDNFVSNATSTIAYNRFLYANGNPMKYTDPSGEFLVWSIGTGGFSVGLNFTPIGVPLGFGVNVGTSQGGSVGVYGEVGYRVGGTGFGAGATISRSLDYSFANHQFTTSSSVGVYGSLALLNAGGSVSYTESFYGDKGTLDWGVSAGINLKGSNDQRGLGFNIGYGSQGWNAGMGGYYNSNAWESNPAYDPECYNSTKFIMDRNNCYSYALDDLYNGNYWGLQPGYTYGDKYEASEISLERIKNAALRDGRVKKPNFFNKLGFGKKGYYSAYLVVENGNDYHWYRQDDGGRWSHKPGRTPATNLDGSGAIISNIKGANHKYRAANYKDGGVLLWVKRR